MPFKPSDYASTYLGGLQSAGNRQETALGGAALRQLAKKRAAEYGAQIAADNREFAAQQAAADRSAARGNAIFGALGNIAGTALTSGITQMRLNQSQPKGLNLEGIQQYMDTQTPGIGYSPAPTQSSGLNLGDIQSYMDNRTPSFTFGSSYFN